MTHSLLRTASAVLALAFVCGTTLGGIVAHYPFDEGSGTTANDVSGNGNTLTFSSTPSSWNATGAFGGSVTVSGQSALARAGGVNPGTITNFQSVTGNKATVTFWAKPNSESIGSNPFYINDSNSGEGNRILASHLEWGNGRIYWDADWGDGSNQRVDVAGGATADRLHHYAMTYNGDTGRMEIHKDGHLLAGKNAGTDAAIGWNNIRNVEIGARSFIGYWAGTVDEFAVLDEALDARQVRNVMNQGVAAYDAAEPKAEIVPNLVEGRFIRINKTKPDNTDVPLHIGEVRALAEPGLDYALASAGASASTIHGTTFHGADGNLINGAATTGGSTWTRDDQQTGPGVYEVEGLVDLGQTRSVNAIQLLQRGDGCCGDRLKDFTITYEADNGSGQPGAVLATQYFPGQAPQVTTMSLGQTVQPGGDGEIGVAVVGQTARFVQVTNNGYANRALHIGEIEAFAPGVVPNNDAVPSSNDIGGTSFHSLVGSGGHGSTSNPLDGDLESMGNVWTRNGLAASYTVDLNSSTYVDRVRLWQRTDCCYDRLQNFTVSLLADDGTGNPGGVLSTMSFPGQVPAGSFTELAFPNAFTIAAADTLKIDIDGAAGLADLLQVGMLGDGLLAIEEGATLEINLMSAPAETGTAWFELLDFGQLAGTFDEIRFSTSRADVGLDTSRLYETGEVGVVVPEPATLALLGLSALGLGGYVRRRKKA